MLLNEVNIFLQDLVLLSLLHKYISLVHDHEDRDSKIYFEHSFSEGHLHPNILLARISVILLLLSSDLSLLLFLDQIASIIDFWLLISLHHFNDLLLHLLELTRGQLGQHGEESFRKGAEPLTEGGKHVEGLVQV
jgi:hypothetical protein